MRGPEPTTDREYLMQIYSMLGVSIELAEKHEKRICVLEEGQQEELLWRNRIIGGGIVATGLLSTGIALVKVLG